jgi:hypothetical protein
MSSKRKAARDTWKSCGDLTPEDFERHPLWGFDLMREGDADGDETWVRPYEFDRVPRSTDTLFTAAVVRSRSGRTRPGAITFRFGGGKVEFDPGVILLRPRYCVVSSDERGMVPDFDLWILRRTLPRLDVLFPLSYEGLVKIGTREFPCSGSIRLPRSAR